MHPIQSQIINKLMFNSFLRYGQLKPKNIEGNLFMYHLKKLIDEGLVAKIDGAYNHFAKTVDTSTDEGEEGFKLPRPISGEVVENLIKANRGLSRGKVYKLTSKGALYADRLSLESLKVRIQPKIVTLVACQNERGEYLIYLRKREPFFGLAGFPYGKIHLGEKIGEAAQRELEEKTGLSAKLKHRGDVYITVYNRSAETVDTSTDEGERFQASAQISGAVESFKKKTTADFQPAEAYQNEELVSQMFCHIFSADNVKGELIEDTIIGKCFWQKIVDLKDANFMPGFADIFRLIKKGDEGLFFDEFEYHI